MNGTGSGRARPTVLQADPLADLREVLQATRPGADTGLIRRAYDIAAALYDALVAGRSWPEADFTGWLSGQIRQALLPPAG